MENGSGVNVCALCLQFAAPAERNQQSCYVQMPVYLVINVRRVDIADRMLLFYFSDRHCCNTTNHMSHENGCRKIT